MSNEYQHLILTWFNLYFPKWGAFKGCNEAWLDRRFALFMRFCYPSIRAQTCQDFEWLVFFHRDTPPRHKAMIQTLADDYPNLRPMFVDESIAGTGLAGARCMTRALVERPYLITTRLCNDDSLSSNFVATVQKKFARQRMQFVHFPVGYYYNARTGKVHGHRYPSNFFMSLIEDTRHSRRTVIDFEHNSVKRDHSHKMLDVETKAPAWLVVVHGGNKKCGMRGRPIDPSLLQRHFPFVSL